MLQEVFSAAFNAILDDDRPINVRPWLYRIARNRSLNHLRRIQAVGVDSMDIHLSEHGATTADKVHEREEFRLLVGDIHGLPETQRTALVLREMDALSYEQIAEAMETTVPSVKSLLVRARVSLAEAAAGADADLRARCGSSWARWPRACAAGPARSSAGTCAPASAARPSRASSGETSKALAALLPIGFAPLVLLRKLAIVHLGHSAGAGAGSSASGAGAAGQAAAVGSTAAAGATAVMGSTDERLPVGQRRARSPPRRPPGWPPPRWSPPARSRSTSRRAAVRAITPSTTQVASVPTPTVATDADDDVARRAAAPPSSPAPT